MSGVAARFICRQPRDRRRYRHRYERVELSLRAAVVTEKMLSRMSLRDARLMRRVARHRRRHSFIEFYALRWRAAPRAALCALIARYAITIHFTIRFIVSGRLPCQQRSAWAAKSRSAAAWWHMKYYGPRAGEARQVRQAQPRMQAPYACRQAGRRCGMQRRWRGSGAQARGGSAGAQRCSARHHLPSPPPSSLPPTST